MVLGLAEGFGKVPVEDGLAEEAHAFVGMNIAAAGDVVAGVDELKVLVLRRAEEAHGRRVADLAHEIFFHLPVHSLLEIWRVKGTEDLPHQILLLFGVEGVKPLLWADVPPVADVAALVVVGWQHDLAALLFREAFVELHGQGVFVSGLCSEPWHGC